MALEDHIVRIRVEGNAKEELKETGAAAEDLSGGVDKASVSGDNFAKTAATMVAIAGALKVLIIDSVKEFRDYDAIIGRVNTQLKETGLNTAQARRETRRLQELFEDNSAFGVAVDEQFEGYRKLLEASNDRTKAEEDLRLAIDISSQSGKDLAATTEALTKIRQGDIGALKELNAVSKDTLKNLEAETNEAIRTANAIDILKKSYDGAAEANRGLADQSERLSSQFDRSQVAIGRIVTTLGGTSSGLISKLLETIGILDEGEDVIEASVDNLEELADFFTSVAAGVDSIDIAKIAQLAISVAALANPIGILNPATRTAALGGLADFFREVGEAGDDAIAKQEQQIAQQEEQEKLLKFAASNEGYAKIADDRERALKAEKAITDAAKANAAEAERLRRETEEINRLRAEREQDRARDSQTNDELAAIDAEIESLQNRELAAQLRLQGLEFEAKEVEIRASNVLQTEKLLALEKNRAAFLASAAKARLAEQQRLQKAANDRAKAEAAAAAATLKTTQAIGSAVASAAQQAGVPLGIISKAQGAAEVGRGIAASVGAPLFGILPNPAEAIGHFSAAANLFGVFELLGLGSGGTVPSPGSASASTQGSTPTPTGPGSTTTGNTPFSLAPSQQGVASVTLVQDFSNSVLLENDLATQRRLGEATTEAARLTLSPAGR